MDVTLQDGPAAGRVVTVNRPGAHAIVVMEIADSGTLHLVQRELTYDMSGRYRGAGEWCCPPHLWPKNAHRPR